jgi:hypothetical protein
MVVLRNPGSDARACRHGYSFFALVLALIRLVSEFGVNARVLRMSASLRGSMII